MGAMPLLPALMLDQLSSTVLPTGVTSPSPVTTTLLRAISIPPDIQYDRAPPRGAVHCAHYNDSLRRMPPRQAARRRQSRLATASRLPLTATKKPPRGAAFYRESDLSLVRRHRPPP